MCDDTAVNSTLATYYATLVAAGLFAGLALLSVLFAWGSLAKPALTWACFVSLTAGFTALIICRITSMAYFQCRVGGPTTADSPCWNNWANYRNALDANMATTGILMGLVIAELGVIPGPWNAPALEVIVGAIAIEIIAATALAVFFAGFRSCLNQNTRN